MPTLLTWLMSSQANYILKSQNEEKTFLISSLFLIGNKQKYYDYMPYQRCLFGDSFYNQKILYIIMDTPIVITYYSL